MDGMFAAMTEAMIAGLGGASRRDRISFALAGSLMQWCASPPPRDPNSWICS
jgi:hypothetical protein